MVLKFYFLVVTVFSFFLFKSHNSNKNTEIENNDNTKKITLENYQHLFCLVVFFAYNTNLDQVHKECFSDINLHYYY